MAVVVDGRKAGRQAGSALVNIATGAATSPPQKSGEFHLRLGVCVWLGVICSGSGSGYLPTDVVSWLRLEGRMFSCPNEAV